MTATLSLRATHRVLTDDHPPMYCLREADATRTAEQRLPRSSLVELHSVHAQTGEETWEFWRAFP